MSRKKLLIVSDYVKWTLWGIETYIKNLEEILPDYEIEYFGWENISWIKKYFFLILSNFNFIYTKKIRKKLDTFKPDIVRFHSVSRLLWPKVVEQIKDFKWTKIQTYHDFWYFALFATNVYNETDIPEKFTLWDFLKKAWTKWYLLLPYSIYKFAKLKKLRKVLRENIDVHTVPSNFMKKYWEKLWYADKITVLPNFILKEQIWKRKEIYQDKINFIFFGRLEKEKWIQLLIHFLSTLWELKYKDKNKYDEITSKIRIFIFGDGKLEKELLETFVWEDINWKDISILENLKDKNIDNLDNILDKWKFVYYFGRRYFETIKKFIWFSHYQLVVSLFLETFWLSAVEWAANWLVNIWLDKENIKNFILDDFIIKTDNIVKNFDKKMFEIIENHTHKTWKENSLKNKKLVEKYII